MPDGRESSYKESFTVSPSDTIIAKNVKPLPDKVQKNIVDLDLRKNGKICLIDDVNLPKIKPGDVILGAGGIVPPLKVLQILPYQKNIVCMKIEIASLEDVFIQSPDKSITNGNGPIKLNYSLNNKKGVNFNPGNNKNIKSKWPKSVVDCNQKGYEYRYNNRNKLNTSTSGKDTNNSSKYNVDRHLPKPSDILPDPSNQYIFDILDESKKSATVQRSDKNKKGNFTSTTKTRKEQSIKSQAYMGFDFNPTVDGFIGFNKGLRLGINGGANETLIGGVTLDALYDYKKTFEKTLASLEGLEAPRINFFIGPVPVWIDFPLFLDFVWKSEFNLDIKDGVFGLLQTGFFDFDIRYEGGFKTSSNTDSLSAAMICGEFDIEGQTKPAFIPRVQFLLYSLAGPQLGLETYAKGGFSRPLRDVKIVQPINDSFFNQGDLIKLQANIGNSSNLPIKISAGLDLNGKLLAANRLLFPPYRLEIIGKKCIYKWCTDPVVVEFDINKYFKKFDFKIELGKIQKEIAAKIPFSIAPFEQLSGASMDDAHVIWKLDGSEIGISNPSIVQDIPTQELASGKHKLEIIVYAPIDTDLKNPLGKDTLNFNLN